MKKRILPLMLLLFVCFATLCPLHARAVTPLDPDAEASLVLHYQKEGVAFADLQIGVYRVAEAFADGSFQLIEPFASYPINIHGITTQEQWNHAAQTVDAYIVADRITPDYELMTDENGTVCFSKVDTGLYFVPGVVAENTSGTYVFNQFMIYVPTPLPDGTYVYDVEANPKCTGFVPKNQYSVTKLWQDGGNRDLRPEEVTVDIYKDGALHETQILNADNNWTYTWYVSGEDHSKWTVAERTVPDGYKVTIQCNGSNFSVINTRQTPPDIPQTGDSATLMLWVLLMSFSGIMLVIVGIYSRRRG